MINKPNIHEPSFECAIEVFTMVPELFVKRGLELLVENKISCMDIKNAMKFWQDIGLLSDEDANSIITLMNARTDERPPIDLLDMIGDNACLKKQ